MKKKSFLIGTRFFFLIAVLSILFQLDLYAKTVMGVVIDKATGKPIPDALVILLDNDKIYATAIVDTAGMFFFTNVEIEGFDLWTKRMGYVQIKTGPFQMAKLDVLNMVIKMEATDIIMSEIVVDEKAMDAYLDKVGFENRKNGPGTYLTYKDIINKPHATLSAVLKNIPSVIIKEGLGGSKIYSIRYIWRANLSPENVNKQVNLQPIAGVTLYIDGLYESDHNIINYLDPKEIIGIEFYRSGGLAPMQYSGGCGSLLIWTKKQ
jgi:hypothetical protein